MVRSGEYCQQPPKSGRSWCGKALIRRPCGEIGTHVPTGAAVFNEACGGVLSDGDGHRRLRRCAQMGERSEGRLVSAPNRDPLSGASDTMFGVGQYLTRRTRDLSAAVGARALALVPSSSCGGSSSLQSPHVTSRGPAVHPQLCLDAQQIATADARNVQHLQERETP